MKTVRQFMVAGVFLAATLMGCGSSESVGPNGRPTGKWAGTLVSGTFGVAMNMVLIEDAAGKVTGNGFLQSTVGGVTNATAALTVAGTFVAPHLSANISSQGFATLNLSGPVTGNTIKAFLNGSGFNNETIVLTRQ